MHVRILLLEDLADVKRSERTMLLIAMWLAEGAVNHLLQIQSLLVWRIEFLYSLSLLVGVPIAKLLITNLMKQLSIQLLIFNLVIIIDKLALWYLYGQETA